MKTFVKAVATAALFAVALGGFGSAAVAGDCAPAVRVQAVTVAQPVVVAQAVVAAPVFVVPSAPTVAVFQQVVAAPVVHQVVQQQVVRKVVQQRAPVTRSITITRTR